MSKYVDVEWLIKESMPLSFSVQKWVNEVQIMTAPSIDIVRCKECKRKGTKDCPMKIWNYTWGDYEFFNDDDDFCSYGKREDK